MLDLALLLVSGPDGVTASTKRLIGMLKKYKIPYMVFINKMDMCERTEEELLSELLEKVGEGFIKYEDIFTKWEEVAALSEVTIEEVPGRGEAK